LEGEFHEYSGNTNLDRIVMFTLRRNALEGLEFVFSELSHVLKISEKILRCWRGDHSDNPDMLTPTTIDFPHPSAPLGIKLNRKEALWP
jgi:hypothetical protein